jgi:hypothetical protein
VGYKGQKTSLHQKQSPKRQSLVPGEKNVVNTPLTKPEKFHLAPLHSNLELEATGQNSVGFMYLKNKFSSISDAKIKEEVFVGLQISKLIQDVKFDGKQNEWKKQHGHHSKMSLPIFWYIARQKTVMMWWLILYNPYKESCEVYYAVKSVFLGLSFRQLPIKSRGSERFHQDISTIEKRYQGEWIPSILSDYCLTLIRYVAQTK